MRLFSAQNKSSSLWFARRPQEFGSLTRFCHSTSRQSTKTNECRSVASPISVNNNTKKLNPFGVQKRSTRSVSFKQHAWAPLQLQSLKRITARRRVPRLFVYAPGYRVRCARLWMTSSCEMMLAETLFPPLQSRQQGLRTPKVFIPESKPRGDFHQLDARLRLIRLLRLQSHWWIEVLLW